MAGKSYGIGRAQIAGLFILRLLLGSFLLFGGIEKIINIKTYLPIFSGTMSPLTKYYVSMPMPHAFNLTESTVYILLFVQITIGLCLLIGLFTRLFGALVFASMAHTLYLSFKIFLNGHISLMASSYIWSMVMVVIIALVLMISAAGRYIGVDKLIVKNGFTGLIS